MEVKTKSNVVFAFVSFLVFAGLAMGSDHRDPEVDICDHQCRVQTAYDETQRQACLAKCEMYRRAKESREQQQHGGSSAGERTEINNPYVFQPRHFQVRHVSEQGRFSVLPRFTERSEIFEGIEPFRFGVLEVESKTLVAPNHQDADLICFVAEGNGILHLIRNNKRETFNIKEGQIVWIPAGATVNVINKDNSRKLRIIKIIQTISTPGRFQLFFGAGRQSFLNAFSRSIEEAAYSKASRETLEKVLGKQNEGPFIQISDEQLKSISHDNVWPWKTDKSSKRSLNIFKHESVSNNYGQLFEVDEDDIKEIEDANENINVAFANITQGGMLGPLFNSRGTKIQFVVEGDGWMEMVTPQSSSSSHSAAGATPSYERVSARLRAGTAVVIPPGRPYVNVASRNQNLQLLCFHINARDNERVPLAGKNNIFLEMDDNVKEIAFGVSAKELDQVFESNKDQELFFKGPERQEEEEEGDRADQ